MLIDCKLFNFSELSNINGCKTQIQLVFPNNFAKTYSSYLVLKLNYHHLAVFHTNIKYFVFVLLNKFETIGYYMQWLLSVLYFVICRNNYLFYQKTNYVSKQIILHSIHILSYFQNFIFNLFNGYIINSIWWRLWLFKQCKYIKDHLLVTEKIYEIVFW
jgi:hypothetical protein